MAARAGLADVLRTAGPAYLATHSLSPREAKVWRAIVACRTAALGGHIERCDGCGALRHLYNSCRNRHCPQCQTRAKEAWLAARRSELLPVPYFHLVFTLPHALNGLAARHARAMYDILFEAASTTLTEFAANPRWLGGTSAFTLVLHTWKQDLGRHIHVHALVTGGALSEEGQWKSSKPGLLFPVQAMSKVFRSRYMTALAARRGIGALRDDATLAGRSWYDLKETLYRHEWVLSALPARSLCRHRCHHGCKRLVVSTGATMSNNWNEISIPSLTGDVMRHRGRTRACRRNPAPSSSIPVALSTFTPPTRSRNQEVRRYWANILTSGR